MALKEFKQKIDTFLSKPPISHIFDYLEEKTRINRKIFAFVFLIILFWLTSGILAPLAVNVIGFAYPAVQSIKTLETANIDMAEKWLAYWLVYG